MVDKREPDGIVLTAAQKKSRRERSIAIALALAINVYRRREGSRALRATRKLFAFSILYLFALFAVLLLEVVAHALAPSIW